jgi:hypothetical protein
MIRRETPGEAYTFVTGSKGGIGAIGALCKEYGQHIKMKPNEIPIIRLDVKSYQHSNRSYGRIKVPYLEVIGWVDKGKYDRGGADPSVLAPMTPKRPPLSRISVPSRQLKRVVAPLHPRSRNMMMTCRHSDERRT